MFIITIFSVAQQPPVGHGHFIVEALWLDMSHSVRITWTGDQPVAETCNWQHSQQTYLHKY